MDHSRRVAKAIVRMRDADAAPRAMLPVIAAALVGLLLAAAPPTARAASAEGAGATLTVTSDYIKRGVSQTLVAPAVQLGGHYAHASGFYAGLWASNVDFTEGVFFEDSADHELDLFVGYASPLAANWVLDASFVHYAYPGTAAGVDYDYRELLLSIRYRNRISVSVGFTDDLAGYFVGGQGQGQQAVAYELSGAHPLAHGLYLEAGAGYYDLSAVFASTYAYWHLGVSGSRGRYSAQLGLYGTAGNAGEIWGRRLSETRLVAGLSVTF